MFVWKKIGLIFKPNSEFYWMKSHAQLPTVDHLDASIYRVYFASRDEYNISRIGYFDIDIRFPDIILDCSVSPVLSPGPPGCFDEHGVYPSSIITINGIKYLYYIGWNKGSEYPLFYSSIGLAISEDGGKNFYRFSSAPIMARSQYDPCLVTSPFVFYANGIWKMFYVSGIKWEKYNNRLISFYHIKYAYSYNAINWLPTGHVLLNFKDDSETNIARCSLLKIENQYHCWYSYASLDFSYSIGYALSSDGFLFIRKDNLSFSPETFTFDDQMMCYPYVIRHKDTLYMFYNGNQYGHDGIALAILEGMS
ncbi:hypothetical protein G4V39_00155 [Thermosulfuriphilus ammonigenes]|uniref:Uncharacterized protein n=1 Tax=Thermosulfuriphilus ammonigenes TaxID=1936021 RepID=A0A6G7PSX2_9BACT|nr:hypothetical protein [Thermosulfuriphilus ammonigenes]MBA2849157.1 putative GH43/DUF377 family glycosyl hydrolase [Thermosulfuriphilus ammonigenes]QIJ70775.1 hypothetical protein G4V39_00155 [Thermosulfuriphilus ammonigenes]